VRTDSDRHHPLRQVGRGVGRAVSAARPADHPYDLSPRLGQSAHDPIGLPDTPWRPGWWGHLPWTIHTRTYHHWIHPSRTQQHGGGCGPARRRGPEVGQSCKTSHSPFEFPWLTTIPRSLGNRWQAAELGRVGYWHPSRMPRLPAADWSAQGRLAAAARGGSGN